MISFLDWVKKHNIPHAAVVDLINATDYTPVPGAESEAGIQASIRREASQKGCRLWRNNSGVLTNPETGVPVRFGLCNDSPKLSKYMASSDLIGVRPVLIGPEHVGKVVGQFLAREVKQASWKYKHTEREQRQAAFIALVRSLGGDAAFANCEGTI